MLLTVDIGNTMIKLGLYDGPELKYVYTTRSDQKKTIEEFSATVRLFLLDKSINPKDVDEAIISCVVPSLKSIWKSLISSLFDTRPLVLGPRLKSGMRIVVDNPKEVGTDLIADGVGALYHYGPSTLIVDFGTATKIMLLDNTGAWAGCSIGPGVTMAMNGLSEKTSALPEVSITIPDHVIGKNTNDAINSALTHGFAYGVKGVCDAFEKEVNYPLKRIITGGNASYLLPLFDEFAYEEHLSLEGLRLIYERNRR